MLASKDAVAIGSSGFKPVADSLVPFASGVVAAVVGMALSYLAHLLTVWEARSAWCSSLLGDLGLGLVLNGLVALTGVWIVMLLYNLGSGANAFDDLNALVERALVGSVAAPAMLILLKALAASDAATFLAGATHGRATR